MARRRPRLSGSGPAEGADRIALAIAFLVGAGGSVALKFTDLHPGVAALWSAAVLVGYALLIWGFGTLRIEPETTGDNCYYLGFVFTLTSLAVTLYQMSGGTPGPDALRDVISGFGIALSSTIVGIVLRVWLMRLRPDLVARDREARIELHSMVREFRTALADSTATIKAYAVESSQLMSEEHSKLRRVTEDMLKNTRQSMLKGAEVQMDVLERTIEHGATSAAEAIAASVEQALAKSSETLSESVAGIRASLAEFVRQESETMRKLVADSASLSAGGGEVRNAIADVAERLDHLATRLEQTSGTITERLGDASDAIESSTVAAAERIDGSFRRLAEASEHLASADYHRRVAEACEKNVAALEAAAARLETLANRLETGAGRGVALIPADVPRRGDSEAARPAEAGSQRSGTGGPEADAPGTSGGPPAPPSPPQGPGREGRRSFLRVFGSGD